MNTGIALSKKVSFDLIQLATLANGRQVDLVIMLKGLNQVIIDINELNAIRDTVFEACKPKIEERELKLEKLYNLSPIGNLLRPFMGKLTTLSPEEITKFFNEISEKAMKNEEYKNHLINLSVDSNLYYDIMGFDISDEFEKARENWHLKNRIIFKNIILCSNLQHFLFHFFRYYF